MAASHGTPKPKTTELAILGDHPVGGPGNPFFKIPHVVLAVILQIEFQLIRRDTAQEIRAFRHTPHHQDAVRHAGFRVYLDAQRVNLLESPGVVQAFLRHGQEAAEVDVLLVGGPQLSDRLRVRDGSPDPVLLELLKGLEVLQEGPVVRAQGRAERLVRVQEEAKTFLDGYRILLAQLRGTLLHLDRWHVRDYRLPLRQGGRQFGVFAERVRVLD